MAAFAKPPAARLLLCLSRPSALRQPTRIPASRLFRTIASRQAAQPQRPLQALKPKLPGQKSPAQPPAAATAPATTTPAARKASPTAYAFVKQLVERGTPTILYEAPSHAWMKFGSWTTSIFSFSVAGYNLHLYTHPAPGLAWYVNGSYSLIAMAFIFVGANWLLRTHGIVNTIRALPVSPAAGAQLHGMGSARKPLLNLEVTIKRTIPFMRPKVIVVPYSDVALKSRIVSPAAYVTDPVARLERKRAEAAAKEQKRKYEMAHLFTAPFRHAGRGAKAAFRGLKQLFTGSGFGTLKVGEKSYRFDVSNAWMLDDGRALDRLVKVVGVDYSTESLWARLYQ